MFTISFVCFFDEIANFKIWILKEQMRVSKRDKYIMKINTNPKLEHSTYVYLGEQIYQSKPFQAPCQNEGHGQD